MKLLGAILCGGRARRFGSDKALALLGGTALIDHVRAGLAPQVDGVIACGRRMAGLSSVADRPEPDLGPLGGLNAALHAALEGGYDAVLSVPCDTPSLPADLRARLERAMLPAYVAGLPVMGLWPATLVPMLDEFLRRDARRSMRGWAARSGAVAIEIGVAIPNVNTPDELELLAALSAGDSGGRRR